MADGGCCGMLVSAALVYKRQAINRQKFPVNTTIEGEVGPGRKEYDREHEPLFTLLTVARRERRRLLFPRFSIVS